MDDLFDDGDSDVIPTQTAVIGTSAGTAALSGQAAGCFTGSDGINVYYQVIGER